MIEFTQDNGDVVAVNPDHVSFVHGFDTTIPPVRNMTEVLFLSGDWRTFDMPVKKVLEALDDARRAL